MALTYEFLSRTQSRNAYVNVMRLTFDNSYPAGGEALSANNCGMSVIDSVNVCPEYGSGNIIPAYDATNKKVILRNAGVCSISRSFTSATMTDNTDTTGFIDFVETIPALSLVLGWKIVTSVGFTGDTTATAQIGIAGTLAAFSTTTNGSVLAAGSISSNAPIATSNRVAVTTPRITITGAADFTSIAAGTAVATLFYVPFASDEVADTKDMSAFKAIATVIGH